MKKKSQLKILESSYDQNFWQNFAVFNWEKQPLKVRNFPAKILQMNDSEIFKLLVAYGNKCRLKNDPTGFKFYIEGFKVSEEEILQVLPEKEDLSLAGYHARMSQTFSDYCLVCDELLTVNTRKQHLLRDFTNQLYKHVGFPNRFSEIGLYLGNYQKTPFGVHVDSCGVFSFPVVGKKRFRLWSSEYVQKNPALNRAFEYHRHKKASQLLEAGPGDMTYWPSSAWHIAESDGSFSATWSLGVWVDKTQHETFIEDLSNLLSTQNNDLDLSTMTTYKTLYSATGEVSTLPAAYRRSIQKLKKLSVVELQENALKHWMQHISKQGFKNTTTSNLPVGTKSCIRLAQRTSPILWQKSLHQKGLYYFSFSGLLIEHKPSSGFLNLIEDLNQHKACQISSYLKGSKAASEILLLKTLAKSSAFIKA